MIVEKQAPASISQAISQTVDFVIQNCEGQKPNGQCTVCLAIHDPNDSLIRLSDSNGRLLMEEENFSSCTFLIKNLEAGIYYFEINDGFFYQIKEVRISA